LSYHIAGIKGLTGTPKDNSRVVMGTIETSSKTVIDIVELTLWLCFQAIWILENSNWNCASTVEIRLWGFARSKPLLERGTTNLRARFP